MATWFEVPLLVDKTNYFKKIGYEPHGGQVSFHNSPARFRTAVCGRRYGKSTMAARDVSPELFLPDKLFWIVGPTYDLGEKEFRIIWQDLMVKQGLAKDKRIRKAFNKRSGSMYIEMPWNTRIEVRSADIPENLVGEALDGVIMSEAAKHKPETWERFIRPALADKLGWGTFTTTPEGFNWMYDNYMLGLDTDLPEYASWRMPSWENNIVFPGGRDDPEILMLEATTSAEWFAQEIGAEFTSFVGKVYTEFDENVHIQQHDYRPEWPNYIFFDWGFVNPLAALDVQIAPNDDVYIWREYYQKWRRLEEHLRDMQNRNQPKGYTITGTYGDSADPEAVVTVNVKFAGCIALDEAKQNWRQGIELVKRFLKVRDGKPKLFIDPSCKNTIREFQGYRMANTPRSGLDPQEKPTKVDDHAMDALRYGLMHIFELGAKYHLEDVMTLSGPADEEDEEETEHVLSPVGQTAGVFTKGMEF